jgi:hypothetical protein
MKLVNRHPHESGQATPELDGVSRRQLLRGVAGSAAVGLLITLPVEAQAHASLSAAPATAGDFLWLFGCENRVEGYRAEVISPAGARVATVAELAHAITRTNDGRHVVDAAAAAGEPSRVRAFDATTGAVVAQLRGGFAWPAEPDLMIAPGQAPSQVAVVGTCMVPTPDGRTLHKQAPQGGTESFPSMTWRTYRAVEVFDVASGALVTTAAPAEIDTGSTAQVAHLGNQLLVLEHGPATTQLLAAPASNPHDVTRTSTGGHARLAATDRSGRAYLLTDTGQLAIWSGSSIRTVAKLGLHSLDNRTAHPFATSVVPTSGATVAVVDANKRYLASVDAVSGKVLAQRSLSTSDTLAPTTNRSGTGVAADVTRRRIYVADTSGVSGGVWVHDANTLEVLDRLHSDVAFGLVWVAPESGTVYLQSLEGPVAVHEAGGRLLSFVSSALVTTRAL